MKKLIGCVWAILVIFAVTPLHSNSQSISTSSGTTVQTSPPVSPGSSVTITVTPVSSLPSSLIGKTRIDVYTLLKRTPGTESVQYLSDHYSLIYQASQRGLTRQMSVYFDTSGYCNAVEESYNQITPATMAWATQSRRPWDIVNDTLTIRYFTSTSPGSTASGSR